MTAALTPPQADLLAVIAAFYGMEVNIVDWPLVEQLIAAGRVRWASEARGPMQHFRRAMVVNTDEES